MIEYTASTGLTSKFRRHNRPSKSRNNSMPQGNGIIPSSGTIVDTVNEHTSLLARPLQDSEGNPLWEDSRPYVKWPAYCAHLTWQTLASNPVNVLLVFVPLGIIAGALHWNATVIFILNFLAIIPLASLLSFATEELSAKLGQTLGGLLNATFGNAVELIVRDHFHFHRSIAYASYRSVLSPSRMAKSGLCNPACLVPSSPTSFLSSAVASLRAASSASSSISTRLSRLLWRLLWLSRRPL